jgi:secondary thiamine-phosphate synthase enzyme
VKQLELEIASRKKFEAIDITGLVEKEVAESKISDGLVFVFLPHCTCALVVNEFEPNIVEDYEKMFSSLGSRDWRHDKIDDNAAAHLFSAVAGCEKFFLVRQGSLVLGTWQKIILLELDGPRRRKIMLSFVESL